MKKNNPKKEDLDIQVFVNKDEIRKYIKTASSSITNNSKKFYGLYNFGKIQKYTNRTNNNSSKFMNYQNFSNIKEAKNKKFSTINQKHIQTPKIKTKYNSTLDKLNTNISLLKGKYKLLLKENYNYKNQLYFLQNRNLAYKTKMDKKIMLEKKNENINNRNIKFKEEQEKNQKMKEIYYQNKKKIYEEKKGEVEKMKKNEEKNLKLHKMSLKKNQMNKKKIKEEEKQYIEEKLIQQKNNYKRDIELRKKINKEKEQKNIERINGNKVYSLRLCEEKLLSKIKIQNSLNKKLSKQYFYCFDKYINEDENIVGSNLI